MLRPALAARRACFLVALTAVGAWLAGCALPVVSAATPAPPAKLLAPAAPVMVGADQVTLLRSGPPTFAELRALIDTARVSVHVEVYEFGHPLLVAAVEAAQRRGVAVTVIDDPSELASAATALRLRSEGVDVVDYPVRKLMIDHVKLLVVDDTVAVIGGINWGVKSPANHDYDAEVRGPVVANLDRVFLRDLATCGRSVAVPPPLPDPGILVAATLPAAEIRPLVLDVVGAARTSLRLELFVITDTSVVRALITAHLRGVDVEVLLDPSQPSSEPSIVALRTGGVDVRIYRSGGELLHAKAIVADESRVLFGSANWSGGGFARNHELDIELPQAPAVAQAMLAQMALDWAASG
ncbi:MAG: phosphatidylserine/phosphatidylglycerophosphate/cardiolipin synthase family protein [Candidatus Dormibacteraeota bacterium]|nr:phosphatidylserine/phosphatidylglycerophosphate/cardiolipin synthase family protein [Candidatus Dormibacteraeota bacterium]